MSDDDDNLRFGDVDRSGNRSGGGGVGGILELMIRTFVGLIILYVMLSTIETLFEIPIPFV